MSECLIWNTPAEYRPTTGDYAILNSPRVSGQYLATGTVHSFSARSNASSCNECAMAFAWQVQRSHDKQREYLLDLLFRVDAAYLAGTD
jgi:hypothetical protein